MATRDIMSGISQFAISIIANRRNPTGRDVYQLNYTNSFANTETPGNTTADMLHGAFHEIITVTTSVTVLSLADSADPMSTLGSNTPSSDPEGGLCKVLILSNLSPDDGTGDTVYCDFGTLGMIGPLTDFSTPGGAVPADAALAILPGGINVWIAPQGGVAMNDGVDDQIRVKTGSIPVQLEVLYAWG